jgi:ABC-type branched-subunit amino acid transport system substrate-binding protein
MNREDAMKRGFTAVLVATIMAIFFGGTAWGEVGVTNDQIVIGTVQDLSGPLAGWSVPWKLGMEMRIQEINKAGGIHGRKLKLVVQDHGYDPKRAIMAVMKIIARDKPFAFVSNAGSPTALAVKPILHRKKIPHLYPISGSRKFYMPFDRYSFLAQTPYYDQGRSIIKYFHKVKGYTRFAMLYQDDEMGADMIKGVKDQIAAIPGCKLVATATYKRGATDFSSQVARLRKAKPQLMIMATIVRETVGVIREAKKIGWKVDKCGFIPSQNRFILLLAKKAGISLDGYMVAAMIPFPYPDSPVPGVKAWLKNFKSFAKQTPGMAAASGYMAMNIFIEAAKRAGRNLTRDKFIKALETFRNWKDPLFGGVPLTFTAKDHKGGAGVIIQQVQKGRFVLITRKPIDWTKP